MKTIHQIIISSITIAICATGFNAIAEETDNQPLEHAVWIDPLEGQAPWADMRTVDMVSISPQIRATGNSIAIVGMDEQQLVVTDAAMNELGTITLPENTQWLSVDEKDRIFVHDGVHLFVAKTWQDALSPEGYTNILDIPNVRQIDISSNHVVYADESTLIIVDLNTGSTKRITLTDFMNDAKAAEMTPEAVQAAEEKAQKQSKKSKKQSKKAEEPSSEQTSQIADIQGIWWRSDGTGVIRIKSLLNEKTYVTTDAGRSWTILSDSPAELTHSHGWIWDGKDRVLSRDGKSWIQVTGPEIAPARRWMTTHNLIITDPLPESWLNMESPELPVLQEEQTDESPGETEQTPVTPTVEVAIIPRQLLPEVLAPDQPPAILYTPIQARGGMRLGLYQNASCKDSKETCDQSEINPPTAWMITSERGFENISLPEGCIPAYASSSLGLGILMCYAEDGEYLVYVRTENTDWQAETILPPTIGTAPELISAEDGTLIVMGPCADETVELPVMPSEEDINNGVTEMQMETRTVYACNAAVRLPEDVGQPDIWRMERMENAHGIIPLRGGRLISAEGTSDTQRKLTLRTAQKTEPIVNQYDASAYDGLVLTNDGCLALYDGSVSAQELQNVYTQEVDAETGVPASPMSIRLLSPEGHLSQMDCSTSRSIEESGANNIEEFQEAAGDARYGVRASAGGFFTTNDVKTWNARIEVLIPIFNGHYEVGLMYRIAGGNTNSAFGHLGLISIRWRYDNFEKFDFAVGAGLGYGTMCGYDSSADAAANDDDENTLPSGYSDCNSASIRYMLGGIAAYKFAERWKLFISAEMLGGTHWGFDLTGGIEIRF